MIFKTDLKTHLLNIPGWRTDRKILVIESDDWGSIRMRSPKDFESLLMAGISVDCSKYDKLDCLEDREDMEALFDIQSKFTDKCGNAPIFTFNTVMGNPNFERIRKSNFSEYYHEHFYQSYRKYHGEDLREVWKFGMDKNYICPQFHAREHLNVPLWMKDLRNGNKETRSAFEHNFFGLKTKTSSAFQKHYLAAYATENLSEFEAVKETVKEGLKLFETTFGFPSKTFIACNYIWSKELEKYLSDLDIITLQTQRGHIGFNLRTGKRKTHYHYTGQTNKNSQLYTVRNVLFEPYENKNTDWIAKAMSEIEIAFRWKKPAIISSHRINYVGGMKKENRSHTLELLKKLLENVLLKYPEIEFMSSEELSLLMHKSIST
ncbi:MAG TPA: hypothetical protein VFM72_06725 [Aequorivita sp.]|nr:hypothetical protein [Aequorivita sp.]